MRRQFGVIAALAAIVVLVLLAILVTRGLTTFLFNTLAFDDGEPDPMFPSEVTRETRPPELIDEATAQPMEEDPSLNWVYETLTPID